MPRGYAGVLTADLHWAADVNSAGFVAGWLQSANVCGRAVASSLWGLVAHRYGPRPVLRITLAALFVGGVLFGCCTNFALAMCRWASSGVVGLGRHLVAPMRRSRFKT